ncbi:MAG: biotin/lipoyl-containing protein, partial [Caldimonas sp.]
MPPPPDGAAARPSPGALRAPLAGTVVEVLVVAGETVAEGAIVLVLESMKMEHEVRTDRGGRVDDVRVRAGDNVAEGEPLLTVRRQDGAIAATGDDGARPTAAAGTTVMFAPAEPASTSASSSPIAEVTLRPDLRELRDREALLADAARPDAIGRRHALGLRSARENIDALCDDGSFIEYGALAFAAQEGRRSRDELIRDTPADGMVTGIGGVNAALFGAERARTVVMAYDATVLAGTQGMRNHQKTDRLLGIARSQGLPVVLFAEGGGGRPGDVDMPVVAGLHVPTF